MPAPLRSVPPASIRGFRALKGVRFEEAHAWHYGQGRLWVRVITEATTQRSCQVTLAVRGDHVRIKWGKLMYLRGSTCQPIEPLASTAFAQRPQVPAKQTRVAGVGSVAGALDPCMSDLGDRDPCKSRHAWTLACQKDGHPL